MEIRETHANRNIGLESPARSEHDNSRWLVWVLRWETQLAMEVTIFIWAFFETEHDEVPLKKIFRIWHRYKVFEIRTCHESLVLLLEPDDS